MLVREDVLLDSRLTIFIFQYIKLAYTVEIPLPFPG